MEFFSPKVREFIEAYRNLFGLQTEGDDIPDEEEEPSEGEIQGVGGNADAGAGFWWLAILKEVSDTTHLDFNECLEMNVYSFFNYLAFARELYRRQEAEMNKNRKIRKY